MQIIHVFEFYFVWEIIVEWAEPAYCEGSMVRQLGNKYKSHLLRNKLLLGGWACTGLQVSLTHGKIQQASHTVMIGNLYDSN